MALKIDHTANIFAALGDPTRLKLVKRLCDDGPLSITALTEGLHVTRQGISKHLKIMEDVGLINGERQGREMIYELSQKRFEIAQKYLEEVSLRWDCALERLRALVED